MDVISIWSLSPYKRKPSLLCVPPSPSLLFQVSGKSDHLSLTHLPIFPFSSLDSESSGLNLFLSLGNTLLADPQGALNWAQRCVAVTARGLLSSCLNTQGAVLDSPSPSPSVFIQSPNLGFSPLKMPRVHCISSFLPPRLQSMLHLCIQKNPPQGCPSGWFLLPNASHCLHVSCPQRRPHLETCQKCIWAPPLAS